ncbi:MAG: O-antigen ligase family protein [Acidobacteriota bacterium]|nr:O-antigen ligase family protein [Acidobacteriota bacterium]
MKRATAARPESTARREWLLKRGHTISYAGLFLFTAILYFRPYELIPAFSFLATAAYWVAIFTIVVFLPTQFALEGNLTTRPREVNLIVPLCLVALLTMPFAISPADAWKMFNETYVKVVLMFIVMVNVVRTQFRLKALILLLLAVTFVLSVAAVNDYRLGHLPVEGYRVQGLIGGMFGNPNDLALHLVTMTPLAVALYFGTRNIFKKILYAACVLLFVGANIVTYSRGGFLGLMCVAGVMVWKLGREKRFTAGVLSLVVGGIFIALAPGNYGLRILSIFDSSLDAHGTGTMRDALLAASVKTAIFNPFFGVGMDNYHIMSIRELVSHNAYTQVATELGIPALIIYIMFMLAPLRRLRRVESETFDARRGSRFYYLAVGLQAAIIGYMVSSFFVSVAYQWYVYYLVGFAVCLRRIYKTTDEAAVPAAAESEITAAADDAAKKETGRRSRFAARTGAVQAR